MSENGVRTAAGTPQNDNPIQTVFDYAQRAVALVAYIVVLGFIVSVVTLSKQTSIFSYAVYPQQYLVSGSLFLVFGTISVIVPMIIGAFLLAFALTLIMSKIATKKWEIASGLKSAFQFWGFLHSHPLWLLLLFALLIVTAFKPESVFPVSSNPSSPSTITIIFKEDIDPVLWLLTPKSGQRRSTQPLYLLAQYTDGLLVKDVATGAIVEIKNDMIAGIIHNPRQPSTVLPNSTATPTTATVTPTP